MFKSSIKQDLRPQPLELIRREVVQVKGGSGSYFTVESARKDEDGNYHIRLRPCSGRCVAHTFEVAPEEILKTRTTVRLLDINYP